jgi:broad-specificity NMP kinase
MPYIDNNRRAEIAQELGDLLEVLDSTDPGEMNYVITAIMTDHLRFGRGIYYQKINELIGILECAKLELYRRLAAPYEDEKIKENGDVY